MANETDDELERRRPGHALTTLRHRNFRLIWCGQLVSTIGGQMQTVAIAWHLYVLTGSSFKVGLVAFFGIAPFIVLSLVGGAIADRLDRKRILITSQVLTMLTSAALVAATLSGNISPGLIYAISFVSGMTRAFDAPARQAMIPNLVPAEELANALTLNTLLRQTATIIGPGLGGLVLGLLGVSATYALNMLSFLAPIYALLVMDPLPAMGATGERGWELAAGGLRFVRSEPVVMSVLGLDFLVSMLGSTRALFPALALEVLDVGEEGLGLLYAAPAVGAVMGALVLGGLGGRWLHPLIILVVSGAFGLFTVAFGLSHLFALSLLMLFGTGVADVIGEVLRATLVQLRTPDALRGRVTAVNVVFTGGGPQLGQVQSGALASWVGPAEAALIGGCAVLAVVAMFALNPHLRRQPAPARLQTGAEAPTRPKTAG